MKIGHPSDNPVSAKTTATASPLKGGQSAVAAATADAATSTQSSGVAVTVSTMARTLSAAKSSDAAVVDMAKVNQVKSAIEKGTFVVNAEAIADKLLSNASEMLNGSKG
jgi:negative regulator of flagellin synthesis FlgM